MPSIFVNSPGVRHPVCQLRIKYSLQVKIYKPNVVLLYLYDLQYICTVYEIAVHR
jgi:hypothetical protein